MINVAQLLKVGGAGRRVLLFHCGYSGAKRIVEGANEIIQLIVLLTGRRICIKTD